MSAEELFATILKSTFTTADFRRRLTLLRLFLEKKYYSQAPGYTLDEFYKEETVTETDRKFLQTLSDEFYAAFTKDTVYSLLGDIEKILKNSPVIILYAAFRMPPEEVEKLGNWVRVNMPPNTIVDLKVDGAAFGGCMFVWNGFLSDYSLRYHLLKHRNEVGQVISKYGQQT